ncbi:hypothetical protein B0H10DRAFT_2047804 [Mycena sp. CBHHK59/15]|nr:hypothetical protein B0H10DRAFT_2047804 [Mycena sp. CBHHK59/15]
MQVFRASSIASRFHTRVVRRLVHTDSESLLYRRTELPKPPDPPLALPFYSVPSISQSDIDQHVSPLYDYNWRVFTEMPNLRLRKNRLERDARTVPMLGKKFWFVKSAGAGQFLTDVVGIAWLEKVDPRITIFFGRRKQHVIVRTHTPRTLDDTLGITDAAVTPGLSSWDLRFAVLLENLFQDKYVTTHQALPLLPMRGPRERHPPDLSLIRHWQKKGAVFAADTVKLDAAWTPLPSDQSIEFPSPLPLDDVPSSPPLEDIPSTPSPENVPSPSPPEDAPSAHLLNIPSAHPLEDVPSCPLVEVDPWPPAPENVPSTPPPEVVLSASPPEDAPWPPTLEDVPSAPPLEDVPSPSPEDVTSRPQIEDTPLPLTLPALPALKDADTVCTDEHLDQFLRPLYAKGWHAAFMPILGEDKLYAPRLCLTGFYSKFSTLGKATKFVRDVVYHPWWCREDTAELHFLIDARTVRAQLVYPPTHRALTLGNLRAALRIEHMFRARHAGSVRPSLVHPYRGHEAHQPSSIEELQRTRETPLRQFHLKHNAKMARTRPQTMNVVEE